VATASLFLRTLPERDIRAKHEIYFRLMAGRVFGVWRLVDDRLASAVVPSRGGRSSVAAGRPLAAARESKVDWAAGVEEDKTFKSQLNHSHGEGWVPRSVPRRHQDLGSRLLLEGGPVWHWIHGPVGTESRKGKVSQPLPTVRDSPDADVVGLAEKNLAYNFVS
jgi:hypothetical protein